MVGGDAVADVGLMVGVDGAAWEEAGIIKELKEEGRLYQVDSTKDLDLTTLSLQTATVLHHQAADHNHTATPSQVASLTRLPVATVPKVTVKVKVVTVTRVTLERHTAPRNTNQATIPVRATRPPQRTQGIVTDKPEGMPGRIPVMRRSTAERGRITLGTVRLGGMAINNSLPLMMVEVMPVPQHTMRKATLAPQVAVMENRIMEQDILGNRTLAVRQDDFKCIQPFNQTSHVILSSLSALVNKYHVLAIFAVIKVTKIYTLQSLIHSLSSFVVYLNN